MNQQQAAHPTTPYGAPVSLEQAKTAMAAAEAEALKNNWGVTIAIVDSGDNLVMLHRLDNAQLASVRIAEAKAHSAVQFRRATKALEDTVAAGGMGLRTLTFGVCVAEGVSSFSRTARSSVRSVYRASRPTMMPKSPRQGRTRSHDGWSVGGAAMRPVRPPGERWPSYLAIAVMTSAMMTSAMMTWRPAMMTSTLRMSRLPAAAQAPARGETAPARIRR
jgi:uncharacterized protein GlcG (DUF336 family)